MGDVIKLIVQVDDKASPQIKKVSGATDKATTSAATASKQFKITGASIAKFGAAALAAGAAMGTLIKGLADSKNELIDTATRTGLTAKTIAGLRLAAEGSGLQLTALSAGLQQFPKRMADFARGTGEAKIAFERLGIEVVKADGSLRSADEVLKETATLLQGVENSTERSALATQLFGRAGTGLLQALSGTELKEFVSQAERFGVKVGPAGAKAAGNFQRELAQLGMIADSSRERFLSAFGTGPGGAGGAMKAFGGLLTGLTVAFKSMMDIMREAFGGLTDFIGDLLGEIINMGNIVSHILAFRFGAAADLAENSLRRMASSAMDSAEKTAGAVVDIISLKAIRDGVEAGMAAFETTTAGTTAPIRPRAPTVIKPAVEEDPVSDEGPVTEPVDLDQLLKDLKASEKSLNDSLQAVVDEIKGLPARMVGGFAKVMTNPGSALANSLGPSGAILTTLADLGSKNPKEIAKQFRSFFKNIVRSLVTVIPELLSTLPVILARNIPFIIMGFLKALPKIVQAFLFDMPMAFLKGILMWWRKAWEDIKYAFSTGGERLGQRGREGRRARGGLAAGAIGGAAAGTAVLPGIGTAVGALVGGLIGLIGSKQTGGFIQNDGLFMLHAGERVLPATGAATSSMVQAAGNIGGGQVINIHTNVVDPNSIRQLGILLNREFGSKGRSRGLSIFNNGDPLAGTV